MSMVEPSTPDGMLIAAALAGDEQAFGCLVRRYEAALLRTASSRLSHRELAEEAVQETFLCAHRWLHTYDSRFSFRTWLWTILLNQCSRQARREARHNTPPWGARGPRGKSWPTAEPMPPRPQASPLDELLAREDSRQINELLARLPEVQADALRLRFFGGLTFPEIAAAMKCSEAGAKNRVKTGLLKLSKWLVEDARRPTRQNLQDYK